MYTSVFLWNLQPKGKASVCKSGKVQSTKYKALWLLSVITLMRM